jgi:hypothetical protein
MVSKAPFPRMNHLDLTSSFPIKSSSLAQFKPRPAFRLLHIRVTGWVSLQSIRANVTERADLQFSQTMPELLEFADWAFGLDGLPKLDILAYGGFSHQGRQPNILLCRSRDLKQNTRVRIPHLYLSRRIDRLSKRTSDYGKRFRRI